MDSSNNNKNKKLKNDSNNSTEKMEAEPLAAPQELNIQKEFVTEGKVTVRLCNDDRTFSAFYNPAQEFNRDLSVLAINNFFTFDKFRKEKEIKHLKETKFSICECLSATGLRALRYSMELDPEKIREVIANDMDAKAVDCILNNAKLNNVDLSKFKIYQQEASKLLYSNMGDFEVIDLDPYGSAMPLIDSALLGVKNGGMLCVTFTDMTVLCGNYPETTFYKYGTIPYKTPYCHEMAKRIALFSIASSAGKYKKTIKPLFSFNADFYIRLFFIVKESPEDCKSNSCKFGYVFHCRNCQNRIISPLAEKEDKKIKFKNNTGEKNCSVCDSAMVLSGPFWIDDIHDYDFIENLISSLQKEEYKYLKYNERILNFLNLIKEESVLKENVFSFDYPRFGCDLNLSVPKINLIRGGLDSLGYKMALCYYNAELFKSNAPPEVIYDVFKQYKKENYQKDFMKNINEKSYKYKILTKEIKHVPTFYEYEGSLHVGKFLSNPTANWGPKAKAKLIKPKEDTNEKVNA